MRLSRFQNGVPGPRCRRQAAAKPRRPRMACRPFLEQLEDRTLFATSLLASLPPVTGPGTPQVVQNIGNMSPAVRSCSGWFS